METSGDSKRAKRDGQIFVKDGLRSYRRSYRVGEVYWGAASAGVLVAIVAWVAWRGAHPDPSLYDLGAALGDPAAPGGGEAADGERGPLPPGLAGAGFREGKIGRFSSDDLYVKINGRAGFFQSFGVRSLHAVTLESSSTTEAGASIDIELYDMGEPKNALGAYEGERPPHVPAVAEAGSTYHFDRNAAFLARGAYYVRFIGSDESELVRSELARLVDMFERELAAGERPWAYALLVDQLGLAPGQVSYLKNNAFSFGFARDVYSAALSPADSEQDLQAFVVASADAAAAAALAAQFRDGFASLGAPAGQTPNGVALFKDEFLGTLAAATASGSYVIGVRGSPSEPELVGLLERLKNGLEALPEAVRARARASAIATAAESTAAAGEPRDEPSTEPRPTPTEVVDEY